MKKNGGRLGTGFDSKPEEAFSTYMLTEYEYKVPHCKEKFPYTVTLEHTYNPDFILPANLFCDKIAKDKKICFEVKGRHMVRYDVHKSFFKAKKMEELGYIYIFVFENPKIKLPHAKKTMETWAKESNFNYISLTNTWAWATQIRDIVERYV